MRKLIYLIAVMGLFYAAPSSAQAKLNVFACAPEWGALATELGGDLVEVYTATKAHQDVHHIRAKPSLLAAMRKADLVFCSGASLESGWLPVLLQKAGKPSVQQHDIGWFMASDMVRKLEVMEHADRSMGHVHPEGNPHVHLNPHNILDISDYLAERLFMIDQENGSQYQSNHAAFKARWKTSLQKWETQALQLKGRNVVVYHKSWAYLTDWLGVNIVGSLEPKPGLPPTTNHLEMLLKSLKDEDVAAILVAPYENDRAAKWLSERIDVEVLYLPYTVGGSEKANSLEALFDETVSMMMGAVN